MDLDTTLGPARRRPASFEIDEAQEEIYQDRKRLNKDGDARMAWIEAIEQLLPDHTYSGPDIHNYKWTTRAGTWRLFLDTRAFTWVGVEVTGPGGKWRLSDHRVPYVATFLRLVGALE